VQDPLMRPFFFPLVTHRLLFSSTSPVTCVSFFLTFLLFQSTPKSFCFTLTYTFRCYVTVCPFLALHIFFFGDSLYELLPPATPIFPETSGFFPSLSPPPVRFFLLVLFFWIPPRRRSEFKVGCGSWARSFFSPFLRSGSRLDEMKRRAEPFGSHDSLTNFFFLGLTSPLPCGPFLTKTKGFNRVPFPPLRPRGRSIGGVGTKTN